VFTGVAKAFLDDLEVLDIGDESVLVRVYGFKEEFPDIGRDSHLEDEQPNPLIRKESSSWEDEKG
jgi:hypothetical protein